MATLVQLIKQLNSLQQLSNLHAVVQSIERQQQFIEDFARNNRLLAEFYADDISQELAYRGWFIAGSLHPHQFQPLARVLKMKAEEQIEEFLKTHVRGLVSDVKKRVLTRWQERAQILADAFDAHIAGKYTLSVPVLLAQADGISADLLGAYLFTDRKGCSIREAASRAIKSHLAERPLAKSFLSLLLKASGLRLDTRKRDELATSGLIFSPLNRHGVLHGLDCDYATEANSLRGIALIGFLEWVAQVIPIKEESPTSAST
jgi:hypothetical protein